MSASVTEPSPAAGAAPALSPAATRRAIAVLVAGNVLGAVGVASGIAVGSLLVASLGGTVLSGVGQSLSVLGAGLAAVPLARLAAAHGRRRALTLGYCLAALGAVGVLAASVLHQVVLLFAALLLFGAAQATNLQTRYAASDVASPAKRARLMSLVVWATTIGSVAGPNLSQAGADLGGRLGIPGLGGPYLFSLAGFIAAALVLALLLPKGGALAGAHGRKTTPVTAREALAWAGRHPVARFAVLLIAVAHGVMVGVMSMSSINLSQHHHGLPVIGFMLSLHILGMYALSPVFGWLADRIGAMKLALVGIVLLAISLVVGVFAGTSGDLTVNLVALTTLGVGWSAATIASSALFAGVDAGDVRIALQGATDATMSYTGAAAALLSGPVLALIGYAGLNAACGVLLVPAAIVGWLAHRAPDPGFAAAAQR